MPPAHRTTVLCSLWVITVTIPGIITGLGGPEMGEISESEYSNLFVLVGGPKIRVVRSHYGAPDHNSQPDCN
jgi:hypothetical protein